MSVVMSMEEQKDKNTRLVRLTSTESQLIADHTFPQLKLCLWIHRSYSLVAKSMKIR